MANKAEKFRTGKKVSEFSPVTVMLLQKTHKRFNILVGEDPSQQRLAEQILDLHCVCVDTLNDSDVLSDGKPGLYRVLSSGSVTFSPQVRNDTAFWSLDPIEKGSAGANAIVRYAASLLNMEKPDRDFVERLADQLASSGTIDDIRVAIWVAVWLLTGLVPQEVKRWPQPWEDRQLWFSVPGVTPEHRLHSLYYDLTAYALSRADEDATIKKAGLRVSPSKVKYFKKLRLDYGKVHDTIELLDLWRTKRDDPYICAFRISNLWKSSI